MTVPVVQQRTLVLLRHAKSAWPHGVPDHERPLAGKGRRNAQAVGSWFLGEGPRPDLVVCSDAVRARHTWEIVASSLREAPPVRIEPKVYEADTDDLVDLVQVLPVEVMTVVVVGHEPTMSGTSLRLAGPGSDPTALARIGEKYPTNGVAVLRFDVPWARVGPGSGRLDTFAVPRA